MKRSFVGFTVVTALCMTLFGATAARADQIVTWTGNGLDSVVRCEPGGTMYLHWVLTPGEAPVEGTTAELFFNGNDVGTMTPVGDQGALQLTIYPPHTLTFAKLKSASVYADITSGSVGENAVLTISDGCLCK
jgi:hypothetical protein